MLNQNKREGIGFLHIITILLILAKLLHLVTFEWYWCLFPIMLPVILLTSALAVVFTVAAFITPSLSQWSSTISKWQQKLEEWNKQH